MQSRVLAAWMAFGVAGCGEPADRPDPIEVCSNSDCESVTHRRAGQGSGASSGAGGSSGSTGSSAGADEVTVSGNIGLIVEDSFDLSNWLLYGELASVFSLDSNASVVGAQYDGQQFSLSGVELGERTPFLVVPEDDPLRLPTLWRVDTRRSSEQTLPLISEEVLAQIYATVTAATTVDLERGHLVYQFVDQNLVPIAGVSVGSSDAEFIAYASGASWSDDDRSTSAQGLAVLANVPAASFPGSSISVSLSGAVSGAQVLTVVQGAVSYELFVAE